MKLLFLIALISISISFSILLIAPSHVFAISSNQTSSNETTTDSLLKQILNELQQIRQLQQHPVLPISPSTIVPVPPFLSSPPGPEMAVPAPPSFNATTCKQQNDNGVLIECPVFPSGLQPPIPLPPTPPPLAPDCIDTVYGVFCPMN